MRFGIFGAGGFGRELLEAAAHTCKTRYPSAEMVFIDDSETSCEFGGLATVPLSEMSPGDRYIIAVSDGRVRQDIERRCLAAGLEPCSIVDATAHVGPTVAIAPGAILCAGSICTADATIGRHFHANLFSYVAHDCRIGDFVTFAPRVSCNGNVHVGNHAYIGTGAILRQGHPERPLIIGEGAVIGMGAVVTKDVPPYTTVIGNPAKPMAAA